MGTKLAEDVQVGDIILLFTETGPRRRVVQIAPYVGPLAEREDGWRLAAFAGGVGGITLIPGQLLEVE